MSQPAWIAALDVSSPAQEIPVLLAALVPRLEQRFLAISTNLGLSRAQAQLLAQLPPDEPLSQREMSQRLHCAPSSVVGLIDSLEARGWLTRQVDPTDRRINVLILTPSGKSLREQLMDQLLSPPAAVTRLPTSVQEQVRDVLRVVLAELTELPGDGACV